MNIEKLPKSRVKVTFDVTSEEFDKALDEAFNICNKKVTIKGFRKGAAPRHVYEKNFGVESLYDEALNYVLNEKAKEIYADKDLASEICGQFEPNIESTEKIEQGKGFVVSLAFDVYPKVSLGSYKGVKTKKAVLEASEDEVNNVIDGLRKQKADLETKTEQVIENGDVAIFDFLGSVDGVPFEGGKADNYELKIGSGQFIPGFEDQMIGMKSEEEKDLKVTFPKEYQAANLAGKEANFKVKVHEVKAERLPELNDEFVAGLNIENVKTVDELKASKKAELEATKVTSERDRQVDEIINNVLDNTIVELPQSMIDQRVAQLRSQYENQAKMYNIPFETFLGLMNLTKEKFDADTQKQGERQALFNVVISQIIEDEKLTPTKEEIEAKAEEEAKAGKAKKDQLLRDKLQLYYSEVAYNKVVEFLLANAELI